MRHAEHLYLGGHLSYPRTETNKFPPSFDVEGALRQQAGDDRWGAYARRLLDDGPGPGRGAGPTPATTRPSRRRRASTAAGRRAGSSSWRGASSRPCRRTRSGGPASRSASGPGGAPFSRGVLLEPGFLEVLQRAATTKGPASSRAPGGGRRGLAPRRRRAARAATRPRPPHGGRVRRAHGEARHRHGRVDPVAHRERQAQLRPGRLWPAPHRPPWASPSRAASASSTRRSCSPPCARRSRSCATSWRAAAARGAASSRTRFKCSRQICLLHQQPRRRRGPLRHGLRRAARGRQGRRPFARDGPAAQYCSSGAGASSRRRRRSSCSCPRPAPSRASTGRAARPAGRAAALRAPRRARGPRPHGRGVPAFCARCFDVVAGGGAVDGALAALHAAAEEEWGAAPPSLCLECPMPDGHRRSARLSSHATRATSSAARRGGGGAGTRARRRGRGRASCRRGLQSSWARSTRRGGVPSPGIACASHLPRGAPWTKRGRLHAATHRPP